ncbi:type II toxin-antitoxin system HicB family antitoxin [Campylobacter sp. LR264d]|uniref:type II toxin-antitoxin system HicB family antitoxin n=1 Tax=Campylobacter sp. LR264d TaxID=2593544 RepID=UPI001239EF5C|nr:type II toxin-antitoxin system HicB family antitoxin [Campylobacter sp. LR264d]KAA6234430.1 type II toxin-antitoxin system HicB family antitoxin [Campylobacter sp. LR264d]
MKKDINYYLNLPYEIIVRKLSDEEGGEYFARYKDFPYIMGDGQSEATAIENVKSAFSGAIEVMLKCGDKIKEPNSKNKSKNLAIALKESIIDKTDKYSQKLELSRSAFIAKALEQQINYLSKKHI